MLSLLLNLLILWVRLRLQLLSVLLRLLGLLLYLLLLGLRRFGLRVKPVGGGGIAITVVGLAGEDGGLYNEKTAPKKASTGRVYDNFRVRVVSDNCHVVYPMHIR